jgi:hypothetical protein
VYTIVKKYYCDFLLAFTAIIVLIVGPVLIIVFGYDLVGSGITLAEIPLVISLSLIFWRILYDNRKDTISQSFPIVIFMLALFAAILVYWPIRNSYDEMDFVAFKYAIEDVRRTPDGSIYTRGHPYPPLMTQILTVSYGLLDSISRFAGRGGITEHIGWSLVHNWYGTLQITSIAVIMVVSYFFSLRLGLSKNTAVVLSVCLLFSSPIQSGIGISNISIFVACAALVAIALPQKFWFVSAIVVAIGFHLKIYPAVIGIAWIIVRRWREAYSAVIVGCIIAFISAGLGANWNIWVSFVERLAFVKELWIGYGLDITSLLTRSTNFAGIVVSANVIAIIASICKLLIFIWFLYRLVLREWLTKSRRVPFDTDTFRFVGHATDFLTASLFLSPIVWDHHYTIAIPLALWLVATRLCDRPYATISVLTVVFLLPEYPYPLVLLRPAGLIAMLIMTNPAIVAERWQALRLNNPSQNDFRSWNI